MLLITGYSGRLNRDSALLDGMVVDILNAVNLEGHILDCITVALLVVMHLL